MNNKLKQMMKKLWKDESAQGMVEYILILTLVFVLYKVFQPQIKDAFGKATTNIEQQLNSLTSG